MAERETVRRRRLAWAAAAALAVLVVVAAVLVVRDARRTPGPADAPVAAGTPVAATSSPVTSSPATGSPVAVDPSTSGAGPSAGASGPADPSGTATEPGAGSDPTIPGSTKSPVPLDRPGTVDRGLTARVSTLTAVAGRAAGPGELSGAALRASITLTNGSAKTVDLRNTVVSLYYGPDQRPASAVSGPGAANLPQRLKAGASATGRYVYTVPADQRDEVLITVDYSVRTPVVAFRGRAPR